jgi:D-alanyl-D-alanine carboxypeptidase/D-alanyl-D-alanine-endopeptidase (penicillin-binding protein 4)
MTRRLLIFLWMFSFAACGRRETPVLVDAPVKVGVEVDPLLAGVDLAGMSVGYCVLDERGEVMWQKQAHTAFIPASALKTLTTATALEMLGPQFVFQTELRGAKPANGVIEGDVWIIGGGDPMLSTDDLRSMAQQIAKLGVKTIRGRVRGDGSLFGSGLYNNFWNWGDIGNGYGSGVGGLNVDHNRWTVRFQSGALVGEPARLLNSLAGVEFVNEVITGPPGSGDGVNIYGGERAKTLFLRGSVPLQPQPFEVRGALPDPVGTAVRVLTEALREAGVVIEGQESSAGPASHVLLTHESPPLIEIVRSIHELSDNHESECVFRMLGVKGGREAEAVLRAHWKARGLSFSALRMEDGCGLARADYVTPHDLARVQFLAGQGPAGREYRESLLSNDEVRWKGGAMSGVRTWTGWIRLPGGGERAFALMVNHFAEVQAADDLRDRLVRLARERIR